MKTYKISQINEKRILGRTNFGGGDSYVGSAVLSAGAVTSSKDEPLALFWAASALEVAVRATSVWVELSSEYHSNEPWVSVYINGSFVSRFMVEKGDSRWFCLARNLNPQKENLITIYKDTQPMPDDSMHSLLIHQVGLNDDGEFVPVKLRKLKLEFVGDSITSGEGLAGGADEMEWIPQWFVGSKTYAAQTARALDADFSTVSQCGWGLCWGWDGNRNSKIPPFYEQVCGVMKGEFQEKLGSQLAWNFAGGSDFVIINLGTNDNSALKSCDYDAAVIQDAAIEFLKKVRRCNPNAKIIWCWGMIPLDLIPPVLKAAVEAYKVQTGDKNVFALEFDSMDEVEKLPEDKGSRGHPGAKTHKLAAEKLVALIKYLC
ncbi:MAG: hypothetical protein K6A43_09010 [Treponema sp.]|nr:hypothetical protein [Treponema sp.]